MRGRPNKYTEGDIIYILALYNDGMSQYKIGIKLVIPIQTIHYLIKKHK